MSFKLRKKNIPIQIEGHPGHVYASHGQTLLHSLQDAGVEIPSSCGGMGSCTTCRVVVLEGYKNLSSPTELEHEQFEERGFQSEERLSCQTQVKGPVQIRIPHSST